MATITQYKTVVIGKGMIGAAAARHLAHQSDGVALIGPDEPPVRATHDDVFGSHYDEGRIYRILDPNPIWASLAARSVARYAEIQEQSGIPFYEEVGFLVAGQDQEGSRVEGYASTGAALGASVERLSAAGLVQRFPFLQFGPGATGAYEAKQAGHLSPRRLVEAQTVAAERQGATIIRESVLTVTLQSGGLEVTTRSGRRLQAENAIVATGGFANTYAVLPRRLDISVGGRTIVLAEVSEPLRATLRSMPSIVIDGPAVVPDVYVLPPICYPDGRWYVKLGSGSFPHPLSTLDELGSWFRHPGAEGDREALHETLLALIPLLDGAPIHTDTCAVTSTSSGYPYVDLIEEGRICVAVGGNGKAAKSSDEIGRLAAALLLAGAWQDDLPEAAFCARFAD